MSDMGNLMGFDANTVEPASFEPIPAGEYDVVIVASGMKPTKDGMGKYLNLELSVLNGKYQNRKLFDILNLQNKSAQAVEIARGTLSAICRAVGVMTPRDSSELHNKPLRATVVVKKATADYKADNKISGYKPRVGQPQPPEAGGAAVVNEAAPWTPTPEDTVAQAAARF